MNTKTEYKKQKTRKNIQKYAKKSEK